MPSVSASQHRFFEMVAHDPSAAKRLGVPQSVGKEFVAADKGRDLKALPRHVERKSAGGPCGNGGYPAATKW